MANIIQTAKEQGNLQTFLQAVDAAGLTDTLANQGPFTVFAPTDIAFSNLPPGTVENLINDMPTLRNILTYHVIAGEMMASDVMSVDNIETLQGETIATSTEQGGMIDDARILESDIDCDNGVIHLIDTVLIPGERRRAAA